LHWEVDVEWRVQFDADVSFTTGGDLSVRGFRLDLPGHETSQGEVAGLLVRSLALTMVDWVRVSGMEVIPEAHKGSRGGPSDPGTEFEIDRLMMAGNTGTYVDNTQLLAAGIPTVEHLTGLAQIPVHGARFTTAPPAFVGLGTFPVRAFALLPDEKTGPEASTARGLP
jgi:arylformamidase